MPGSRRRAIEPAARSSDEEFVRRVYLDLTGRDSAGRRGAGVSGRQAAGQAGQADRHAARFAGARHAPGQHLAEHHAAGRPQSRADQQRRRRAELAAAAVRREPAVRQPRLRAARGHATAARPGRPSITPRSNWPRKSSPAARPASSWACRSNVPSATTIRSIIGSRRDFWGYAAFFARLRQPDMNNPGMRTCSLIDLDEGEVKLPGTEEVVPPKYPAGASPAAGRAGHAPRAARDLDGLARQPVPAAGRRQPRLVASLRPRPGRAGR